MARAKTKNKNRHLVLSDMHYPYVDKECEREALQEVKESKPGTIHLLGDIADCYAISRHRRDPKRRLELQDDLNQVQDFLVRLRKAAPTSDIRYTEGNHEERLRKYLCDVAPELQCLEALRMPSLLGLKDLGIKWSPADQPYRIGNWWFVHGDLCRKHAGYSARAKAEAVGGNVIMGHTHRLGMVGITTWANTYLGVENGCLCSFDCEYVQGIPNWQHGYTLFNWSSAHQTWFPEFRFIREIVREAA